MKDGDLVVGIMASFSPRAFAVQELIALTRPFGVTGASLRTNLSRLKKKGVIEARRREGKSVYVFTAKGAAITANVALSFSEPQWRGWDKSFWGVLVRLPAADKNGRYRITKKLSLYRFAPLYPGFWIRPYRESERLDKRLESLFSDPRCRAVRFHPLRPFTPAEAAVLWDLADAVAAMAEAMGRARRVLEHIAGSAPEQAFVERYRTGEVMVAALFRDPLLPAVFLPAGWPAGELRRLFKQFDDALEEHSRPFWENILGEPRKTIRRKK
jgi:phenylacetic acid degradation operon negative regulatory protein